MKPVRISLVFAVMVVNVLMAGYAATLHTNRAEGNSSTQMTNVRVGFSCYDSLGRPYIELVPHPYECNHYLHCTQVGQDFFALSRPCAELFLGFSMKSCRCEYKAEAECFDSDNPEHQLNRMKCAKLAG